MKNNSKNKVRYSSKVALILGLIITTTFILVLLFYIPSHKPTLTSSKNTAYNLYSNDSQYELVLALQTAFIYNAKHIGPSVVNLSRVYEIKDRETVYMPMADKEIWFSTIKFWFNKIFREKKYVSETIGSGIIINNSGYILTNYHVIKNREKILIRLSDKRTFFAKVVGSDPLTDLAVLKIFSFRNLPHPSFKTSRKVEVGQWVMAIGNPYGLQGSVTVGVISGISRSGLGITTHEDFIQTDAFIHLGNSGGPLIDLDGNIIGINTSAVAVGSGIGFAMPINMAMRIVEELIENGDVARGWIGINIQGMTPEIAASFNMPNTKNGVLVNSVQDHAPAKAGGMVRGDIVIQYDGKKVLDSKTFKYMVAGTLVGKKVPIKIIRDGHEKRLLVTIGKLNS